MHGGHDILWLQDPIGWEEQSLPFDLQWNVYKLCMVVFVFTLPSLCPEAFSWNVYNWVWVQVVSDLEPPTLCGFTRLPGSTLPYTDFTILCPCYPTPPYFGMALLNCSTRLYLHDSTMFYYTLMFPPVLWLSLLYPTLLYAYWSYSLHYQTLFDCSVHYHGFVPAWFYCTTLLYTTLTIADLTILNGSISGVYLAIESVFYMLVLPYSTISYQIKALPTVCRLYTMVKKWRVIEAW